MLGGAPTHISFNVEQIQVYYWCPTIIRCDTLGPAQLPFRKVLLIIGWNHFQSIKSVLCSCIIIWPREHEKNQYSPLGLLIIPVDFTWFSSRYQSRTIQLQLFSRLPWHFNCCPFLSYPLWLIWHEPTKCLALFIHIHVHAHMTQQWRTK